MLKKNDEIALTVKSCTVQGSGVCDYNGMTVFVRGAVTGDRIIAHIIKVKKTYAVGIIKKILQKSKDRIKPECPIADKCGGCSFAHISYEAELNIKYNQVADNLKRIGGLDIEPMPIIPSPAMLRYRNKAQYPVGDNAGLVDIGFYAPMSHRIIDCADCRLQPAEFKTAVDALREYMEENRVTAYNEMNHSGLVRHLYIRKGFSTDEVMVCIVINGKKLPNQESLISKLTDALPSIKSIQLNINTQKTNVVLGSECLLLWGSDKITDVLCGLKFEISPLSFYQVNHDAAELLYRKAKEYANLSGNETLIDLYCGTGTIGLTMADKAKQLIGIEIIPQAIENAKKNAELNSIENARFICADAVQAARTLCEENIHPDAVILDPPRKGCSAELPELLQKMNPERIVYISCDSATLARDSKLLAELGFELQEVTPVDMFPRTGNVECAALFKRL